MRSPSSRSQMSPLPSYHMSLWPLGHVSFAEVDHPCSHLVLHHRPSEPLSRHFIFSTVIHKTFSSGERDFPNKMTDDKHVSIDKCIFQAINIPLFNDQYESFSELSHERFPVIRSSSFSATDSFSSITAIFSFRQQTPHSTMDLFLGKRVSSQVPASISSNQQSFLLSQAL